MKATEPINRELIQKEHELKRFEFMAREFFDKWQPRDRRESAEFSAELFTLVRQIHMDAVQPHMDQMIKLVRLSPPMIVTKGKE